MAGCLFAKDGNPLRRSLVSLPFSDFCPPLARSDSSRESLMARMAGAIPPRSSLEIRGVAGFAPWHVVDHFQRWTLDLSRPFQAIERAADRETRRHVRRARATGVTIDRLNSAAVRIRGKREFPRWPCESALINYWRDWLKLSLQRLNASDAWHIGLWPDGMKSCIVLTHDVEGPIGMSRMERNGGSRGALQFSLRLEPALAQYAIDWNLVNRLRWRGFEFGAHGLSHDGRLFRSESDFSELAPILEKLARIHGMNGSRAPSTLRRVEWISRLSFDFDCSFSDSDPYEPQPGGTCSVFPFSCPIWSSCLTPCRKTTR
jgi:hypothetical protein